MLDKILGVAVVMATVSTFFASALGCIVKLPNGWGILLAACTLYSGCLVTASVLRDRL